MIPAPNSDAPSIAPVSTPAETWYLDASPSWITAAADQWAAVAAAAANAPVNPGDAMTWLVAEGWAGETCDTYQDHAAKLGRDLAAAATAARTVAASLGRVAHELTSAQNGLSDKLKSAGVPGVRSGDTVTFSPTDPDQLKAVNEAITEAHGIAGLLDAALTDEWININKAVTALDAASSPWRSAANGGNPGWAVPPEPKKPTFMKTDHGLVVDAGSSANDVKISEDAAGKQVVTIDGKAYDVPHGEPVTIVGGAGNDTIDASKGSSSGSYTLIGGAGDDKIIGSPSSSDVLLGLGGADDIEGGAGDRINGELEPKNVPGAVRQILGVHVYEGQASSSSDSADGVTGDQPRAVPDTGSQDDAGSDASSAMIDGVSGGEPRAVPDSGSEDDAGSDASLDSVGKLTIDRAHIVRSTGR